MACFKMDQRKIYLLIRSTSFKMGQITHWAIANKHVQYCYSTLCRLLVDYPSRRNHRFQLNTLVYTNYDCQTESPLKVSLFSGVLNDRLHCQHKFCIAYIYNITLTISSSLSLTSRKLLCVSPPSSSVLSFATVVCSTDSLVVT